MVRSLKPDMSSMAPKFEARFAETTDEVRAAQKLRYDVFVRELGADGPCVDHDAGIEADEFDPFFDHLLLIDHARNGEVVGVYRLLTQEAAKRAGRFYSETEYDLGVLKSSGRNLLELGRSCLHADYRGGTAMMYMWQALAVFVEKNDIDVLFGVASFHGTDTAKLAPALSLLHHNHLAPPELRVRAMPDAYQRMDLMPIDSLDRKSAIKQVPSLIKAYLRLGGTIGDGAFIDHGFNTTDVCLILDTATMNAKTTQRYTRGST